MTERGSMPSRDRLDDRFDRELGLAARSLVTESLPAGVLEQPRPAGSRDGGRVVAIALVVVVLVLAATIGAGLLQRTPPVDAPAFKALGQLELEVGSLGYFCRRGPTASPAVARVEALVCASPGTIHPVVAAIIASDDATGAIVAIKVKAGVLGTPTSAAQAGSRFLLEVLATASFADARDASEALAWIRANALLGPGQEARTTIRGIVVVLDRDAGGGYEVEIGSPLPSPPTATG
jgi:hypothetical protein